MALLLMFILSSFSLVQYEPVKIINGIQVKDEPSEDYDDRYADGYCEAYRDCIGSQYADCAVPPYMAAQQEQKFIISTQDLFV